MVAKAQPQSQVKGALQTRLRHCSVPDTAGNFGVHTGSQVCGSSTASWGASSSDVFLLGSRTRDCPNVQRAACQSCPTFNVPELEILGLSLPLVLLYRLVPSILPSTKSHPAPALVMIVTTIKSA